MGKFFCKNGGVPNKRKTRCKINRLVSGGGGIGPNPKAAVSCAKTEPHPLSQESSSIPPKRPTSQIASSLFKTATERRVRVGFAAFFISYFTPHVRKISPARRGIKRRARAALIKSRTH